jgi:ubiquinone/menaquinone biosynthesis C-methylase UbiE
MQDSDRRDFDAAAKTWDENPARVELANAVAAEILRQVPVTGDMEAMDYGCGTGLVTIALQPHVRSIMGADSSRVMLDVLEQKVRAQGAGNVRTLLVDLEQDPLPDARFDLIVSAMTMHHVADVPRVVSMLGSMLSPGGYLCIADLDKEDGDFHADKTGVRHFGFTRDEMRQAFVEAGLSGVKDSTAHAVRRPTPSGPKEFTVLLVVGRAGITGQ